MFAYLNGIIKERHDAEMILLVGSESAGQVGYLIKTPNHPRYEVFIPGQRAEVYIYTHVREDALDLYGFINAFEKNVFLTLLSINGVGPKVALGILSNADAQSLIQMILSGDKESLTNIPGIGKKTAERIVLELKDSLKKKIENQQIQIEIKEGAGATSIDRSSQLFIEAYLALQALGYKEAQAKQMVEKALMNKSANKVEDVVKLALQGMSS